MITIEFEEPKSSTCECCSGTTTWLTRYVYQDGDAYAVYKAQFSDNHPERIVKVVVSLGEWANDAPPASRRAFAFNLRTGPENYQVSVTDADECPFRHMEILGRVLDREEALKDPWIQEVFHISDHMVVEDEPLKAYLDANPA